MAMENVSAGVPGPMYLLHGCCTEAERAARVASSLDGLLESINPIYRPHLTSVSDEIRMTSRHLCELADRSQVHMSRVPEVLNYLNVLLPCLSKTLRDMTTYYEDKTITREIRWRVLYHTMSKEGGLSLPQRFQLYNHFLLLLGLLLTRSPTFDLNTLDSLQERILKLREDRGIPRPTQIGPILKQELIHIPRERKPHWATEIFSRTPPSRTPFRVKRPRQSETKGPYFNLGDMMRIPPDSKMLFRKLFENGSISVSVYVNPISRSTFILVRQYTRGVSYYAMKGVHELVMTQAAPEALMLKRWSETIQQGKPWAALSFVTWEELVLFHCTFVSLKAYSHLSAKVCLNEYFLRSESRLFAARIIDDGFDHLLSVYRDSATDGIRLHASVLDGELKRCPVWTAFVTHQCQSTTWLERRGRHTIFLKEIQLYVFNQDYHQERMRRNKYGAFEINFHHADSATKFKEVFFPSPSAPPVMKPSEITEANEGTTTPETPLSPMNPESPDGPGPSGSSENPGPGSVA